MKKRTIISVISAFFMVLLMVSLMAGCTTNPPSSSGPGASNAPSDYTFDDLPPAGTYDFKGREFKVFAYYGNPYEDRADFNRRFALRDQIQQRFNCTVTFIPQDYAQLPVYEQAAISGAPTCDYAISATHILPGQYIKGCLMNLSQYDDILKLKTDPRWSTRDMHDATINGSVYALAPAHQELWIYADTWSMFVNRNLLKNAGINLDDIYALQEKNQWTWDKFQEYCNKVSKDVNGDGIDDQWGVTLGGIETVNAFIVANGGSLLKSDDTNGSDTFNGNSNQVIQTLDFFRDLVVTGGAQDPNIDPSGQASPNSFASGTVGFKVDYFQRSWETYKDMTDDYGVLCVPMGKDSSVKDYYVTDEVWLAHIVFIQPTPELSQQSAEFAYVYNSRLFSDQDNQDGYWKEADNRIRDEGSKFYLNHVWDAYTSGNGNLVSTSLNRYSHLQPFIDPGTGFVTVLNGSTSSSQFVQSITDQCNSIIANTYSSGATGG